MADVLQSILTQTGLALAPLRSVKTPGQAVAFFRKLGYEIPPGAFGGALSDLAAQASELVNAVQDLVKAQDDESTIAAIASLFGRVVAIANDIRQLHSQIQAGGGGGLPNIGDLPRRLTDYLILEYLDKQKAQAHQTLHLLGLVEYELTPAANQPMRLVNWNRIGQIFTKPGQIADDVYQWNAGLDAEKLLNRLEGLMRASTLPGGIYPQSATTKALLGNTSDGLKELRFALFQKGTDPATYAQFGITISPAEAQGGKKKGIALLPYLMGTAAFAFDVCDRGELVFNATADIKGIGVIVRPPMNAEGLLGLAAAFKATVQIHEKPDKSQEIILIGTPGGTRLALQGLGMNTFIQNSAGKLDLGFEGELAAIRLVVKGGDGDGFLQKILSGVNVEAEAALAFGFRLWCQRATRGLVAQTHTPVSKTSWRKHCPRSGRKTQSA